MNHHDLRRHLVEGGSEIWDRPEPPALDLQLITGRTPRRGGLLTRVRAALGRRLQLPPLAVVGGAMAFAGAGMAAGVIMQPPAQPRPTTVRVALQPFGEGPASARATVSVTGSPGRTVARMQANGLPKPAPGEHYTVWAIADDGQMVSLGTLPVGEAGAGGGEMPVPVSLKHFHTIDVAVQPDGGPHVHSGRSVLRSSAS